MMTSRMPVMVGTWCRKALGGMCRERANASANASGELLPHEAGNTYDFH